MINPGFGLNRRELLRIGAVSLLAPVAAPLFPASAQAAPVRTSAEPGIGNSTRCLLIFLQGGPSHLDLWDPKPEAPVEVRGDFLPIATATAGLQFTELVPRAAQLTEHLAVIRSMTHRFTNHIAGTYIMHTGSTVQQDRDRETHPADFPGPGAVLNYLQAGRIELPASISLPNWLSIPGPSNRMPGQYSGFLGATYDPFLIQGDPSQTDFRPLNLSLPGDVSSGRLDSRAGLLAQMDAGARHLENLATQTRDRLYEAALELLHDPRIRHAVDLSREPAQHRDRYGRTKLGQSLLLARRLSEAGVKYVAVNEFNQRWDSHNQIHRVLRRLAADWDQAYSALLTDLVGRGLLEETFVVCTGEFGRTPRFNEKGGRDHWPHVYTALLAGGGIRGGQVYGASDAQGAAVQNKPVEPADLLATLWTQLGINPQTELRDRQGRTHVLSTGRPLVELL